MICLESLENTDIKNVKKYLKTLISFPPFATKVKSTYMSIFLFAFKIKKCYNYDIRRYYFGKNKIVEPLQNNY